MDKKAAARIALVLLIVGISAALTILSPATQVNSTGMPSLNKSTAGDKIAFVVPLDDVPSWRDLNLLAAIPAANRANGGQPVVLTSPAGSSDDPAVTHFLNLYAPDTTYRLEQAPLTGSNEQEIAASLSIHFWDQSDMVVLVSNAAYEQALPAATLAAHISSPLLYLEPSSLPTTTRYAILQLEASQALVIGDCAGGVWTELEGLGLTLTNLANAEQVAAYLANGDQHINYVVVTNPLDRDSTLLVPRLSLLAPVLAAYHGGVVYPAAYQTEWKRHFDAPTITTTRPDGATLGSATMSPWWFTPNPPERAAGATWELYGANGNFGWGNVSWITGDSSRSFYLAAATEDTPNYDRVMIDLDNDQAIADEEVLEESDSFFIDGRTYIVSGISGDGIWYQEGGSLSLELHTWQIGSATVNGMNRNFVATSTGFKIDGIGAYDTVHLDLNENGRYDDPGEGPFYPGDVVDIGEKGYALSMSFDGSRWRTEGELKFTYPAYQQICADLQTFYTITNIQPEFLAIVGYYDAIPFGITYAQGYADVEDIVTDKFYGDIDDDPFMDLAVGRVVAEDVHKVSALVARSVTYVDLLDGNWELDSVISTGGEGGHSAIANTMRNHLSNVGLDNINLSHQWDDTYLAGRSVFFHFEHGGPGGMAYGPSYLTNQTIAPLIAMSGGCMTAGLDFTIPEHSVALQLLDLGAVAYLGNTRPASNPIFAYEGAFWTSLIYHSLTIGQAHRRAINTKIVEGEAENDKEHIPVHEAVLYGDPALHWYHPLPIQEAAAYVSLSSTGPAQLEAQYHGPAVWWQETIPCSDGNKEMYSGPGIFFRNFFDDLLFFSEITVTRSVISVTQVTTLNPPLGWTGDYYLDTHQDGTSSILWLLKPIDYDRNTGEIRDEADQIIYRIDLETSPFQSTVYLPLVIKGAYKQ